MSQESSTQTKKGNASPRSGERWIVLRKRILDIGVMHTLFSQRRRYLVEGSDGRLLWFPRRRLIACADRLAGGDK